MENKARRVESYGLVFFNVRLLELFELILSAAHNTSHLTFVGCDTSLGACAREEPVTLDREHLIIDSVASLHEGRGRGLRLLKARLSSCFCRGGSRSSAAE